MFPLKPLKPILPHTWMAMHDHNTLHTLPHAIPLYTYPLKLLPPSCAWSCMATLAVMPLSYSYPFLPTPIPYPPPVLFTTFSLPPFA